MREMAERLSALRRQAEELARELQEIERELNR
jgi:prefoldin subunit 5